MAQAAIVLCKDDDAVNQARLFWEPDRTLLPCNPTDVFAPVVIMEQEGANVTGLTAPHAGYRVLYYTRA